MALFLSRELPELPEGWTIFALRQEFLGKDTRWDCTLTKKDWRDPRSTPIMFKPSSTYGMGKTPCEAVLAARDKIPFTSED